MGDRKVTGAERRVVGVAFSGWALDAMDFMSFALIIPVLIGRARHDSRRSRHDYIGGAPDLRAGRMDGWHSSPTALAASGCCNGWCYGSPRFRCCAALPRRPINC